MPTEPTTSPRMHIVVEPEPVLHSGVPVAAASCDNTRRGIRDDTLKPGQHKLTVHARGSKLSDAVERKIRISPDGALRSRAWNGRVVRTSNLEITIPAEAVPEIKKMGFTSIINLPQPSEQGASIEEEAAAAKAVGLRFYSIPFNGQSPDPAAADRFLDAITAKGSEIWVTKPKRAEIAPTMMPAPQPIAKPHSAFWNVLNPCW